MIEDFLLDDEHVELDFTPNQEEVLKIYKQGIKLCRISMLVLLGLIVTLTIVSKSIIAVFTLSIIFSPIILIVYAMAKAQVIPSKRTLISKYIITNKRCIIYDTKKNSIKYLFFDNIIQIKNNHENSINIHGYSPDGRRRILNYDNVDKFDLAMVTIARYKKY